MDIELMKELDDLNDQSRDLYQSFEADEEVRRIAYHYEVAPEFFQIVTGGLWNTYSCNIWENASNLTQAQENKLDKFAELAKLKPGMKILDVGCGWGGPLVYLCKKYGVNGIGITVSPKAIPIAEQRAEIHNVNAVFSVCPWRDLPEQEKFDAIITDEVIVHFNDLGEFFKKCHRLLKPSGIVVNKELHFRHSVHAHAHDKLSQHINKVFGYSGNYRTLEDEFALLDQANMAVDRIIEIDVADYQKTIYEHWVKNLTSNRAELEALTNKQYVRDFHIYLRGILKIFNQDVFRIHMISAQPI